MLRSLYVMAHPINKEDTRPTFIVFTTNNMSGIIIGGNEASLFEMKEIGEPWIYKESSSIGIRAVFQSTTIQFLDSPLYNIPFRFIHPLPEDF